MNSINIRFEVSFGTGSEYDAEALQKIQQELATTVKRLQAQYTKNNSSRTSPPPKQQTDFFQFARAETENMTKASRFNTARNYRTAIARLHQYVSFTPLPFHSITPLFIDNFEKYLQNQGCNLNTISCYLRTLRAIYNKAVELELTPQQSPFIRAFTGYENTRKRGIPKLLIRKLISLDCSKRPTLQLAKDLFLFSIYVRGISFVDIAFLKKSHIYGNYLTYYRRKTHQQITVKLEPPSLEILNRYADTSQAGYLFPILRDTSPQTITENTVTSWESTTHGSTSSANSWATNIIFHLMYPAIHGPHWPKSKESPYPLSVKVWGTLQKKPHVFT